MNWFDWVAHLPASLEFVILLAAAVAAGYALKKGVYDPVKKAVQKVNSGMDTLVGYPAVMDPGNASKELKPATPPLAERVDTLEDAMHRLIDNQEKMLSLNERLLDLEEWRKQHASWSELWVKEIQDSNTTWQKEHEAMHLLSHQTAVEIAKTEPAP